jgi:hypothetical protein
MEPLSIVALENASARLAGRCGTVAAGLRTLADKHDELSSINTLADDCQIFETTLNDIKAWLEGDERDFCLDEDVLMQLRSTVDGGTKVIAAVENDLALDRASDVGQNGKIVWDERLARLHEERVKVHVHAAACLLQVTKMYE